MRLRIISALVGLIILLVVLAYYNTVVLNITVSIICLIGVFEFLRASGNINNKIISVVSFIPSLLIPFIPYNVLSDNCIVTIVAYTLIMFGILLPTHNKTTTESMSLTLIMSIALPFSLSSVIYVRDFSGVFYGIYYVMLLLCGAWISDTGAYFSGYFFGKRKLAPQISPKKTIEGAFGGVIVCTIFFSLIGVLFTYIGGTLNLDIYINYIFLLFIAPFISLLSIVGDLSASIIKRNHNIKDFGSIMPGHGGILDRFDSVFFVAPFMFIINLYFPFMIIK